MVLVITVCFQYTPDDKVSSEQFRKLFEVAQYLLSEKVQEAAECTEALEEMANENGKELVKKGW